MALTASASFRTPRGEGILPCSHHSMRSDCGDVGSGTARAIRASNQGFIGTGGEVYATSAKYATGSIAERELGLSEAVGGYWSVPDRLRPMFKPNGGARGRIPNADLGDWRQVPWN
jgi:hypothetical protein